LESAQQGAFKFQDGACVVIRREKSYCTDVAVAVLRLARTSSGLSKDVAVMRNCLALYQMAVHFDENRLDGAESAAAAIHTAVEQAYQEADEKQPGGVRGKMEAAVGIVKRSCPATKSRDRPVTDRAAASAKKRKHQPKREEATPKAAEKKAKVEEDRSLGAR
jgi:hypothetical protein